MAAIISAFFDAQRRLSYRKLLVWATGTVIFLATDKLEAEHWLYLSLVYMGADAISRLVSSRGANE